MRKYLFFLKCSSIVVKVAAWILLCLGIAGSASLFLGAVPNNPRWKGFVVLVFYSFSFLVLFFVAKTADVLVQVVNTIQKD